MEKYKAEPAKFCSPRSMGSQERETLEAEAICAAIRVTLEEIFFEGGEYYDEWPLGDELLEYGRQQANGGGDRTCNISLLTANFFPVVLLFKWEENDLFEDYSIADFVEYVYGEGDKFSSFVDALKNFTAEISYAYTCCR